MLSDKTGLQRRVLRMLRCIVLVTVIINTNVGRGCTNERVLHCRSAATRDRTRDLQSDALPTELSRRHNTIVPHLSKFFTHTRSPSRIPRTHPLTARLPLRPGYPHRPSKCRSTTISRQTSRRQPAAAYIAIAPFRPCTDAPSRTAVVCASVSSSRIVP